MGTRCGLKEMVMGVRQTGQFLLDFRRVAVFAEIIGLKESPASQNREPSAALRPAPDTPDLASMTISSVCTRPFFSAACKPRMDAVG